MVTPTDIVELCQVAMSGLATGCSVVALVVHLRTWSHLALLTEGGDRRLRIAAFAFVGRECLRVAMCGCLLSTACISYFALPSPPIGMAYSDWVLLRKTALLAVSALLCVSVVWDLWLRDVLRKTLDDNEHGMSPLPE